MPGLWRTCCSRSRALFTHHTGAFETPHVADRRRVAMAPAASTHGARVADYDYIVIGAGSAGLQMGLYMQRDGASYVIFEKGRDAGTFWRTFPMTGELISANSNTESERYDQHSLLQAPLKFRNVTKKFFPQRGDFHSYLNTIAATLNVVYNTEVVKLLGGPCLILANGRRKCAAHRIFVGTGLAPILWPELEAAGSIPYSRFNTSVVDGMRVCIFGNGNAAWEMAQASYPTAESVAVLGRRPTRWSFVTKYSGDVRIKYAQVRETLFATAKDHGYTVSFLIPMPIPSTAHCTATTAFEYA